MTITDLPATSSTSDGSPKTEIKEQLGSPADAPMEQNGVDEKMLTTLATGLATTQSVTGLADRYRQVLEQAKKGRFGHDVVFEVLRMEAAEWRVEGDRLPPAADSAENSGDRERQVVSETAVPALKADE